MPFGNKKIYVKGKSDESVVMQLGNKQLPLTIPKSVAGFKGIVRGQKLKWSDGGPGRLMLEVVQESGK
ncbi:MAG: hypothetical protein KGH94_00530 [Candidatus Micrarchaeota archaeon]|nr:hypothetical protein [Candidatus Micrarchaeota archaeon]